MLQITFTYLLLFSLCFYQASVTKLVKRHNYQYFSPVIYKHKWITRETKFPLRLQTPLRIDADFKWYKTSEDLFIEEIDNFEKDYRFEQNNDKVILDILKYDHSYHEQLSSYEPRVIGTRTELVQEKEIFSLFYLKSLIIENKNFKGKNMAFCNVTILIPHGDDLILSKNKALVLQNLILKFGTRVKRDVNPIQSYEHNKIRFKRHDSTFVALEYVEGPIYFRKSLFAKSEEVKCNLQLWEDNRIKFQQTISKSIDLSRKLRNSVSSNTHGYKFLSFSIYVFLNLY